jgi:hypothetical protein
MHSMFTDSTETGRPLLLVNSCRLLLFKPADCYLSSQHECVPSVLAVKGQGAMCCGCPIQKLVIGEHWVPARHTD